MGCAASTGTAEERERSRAIDRGIRVEAKEASRQIKLLLLGAGESGKSTIVKQMKVIHLNGYSDAERRSFVRPIYNNIAESMKVLLRATDMLEVELASSNQALGDKYVALPDNTTLGPDAAAELAALWQDPAICQAVAVRSRLQLPDSTDWYFSNLERICVADYVPSVDDILRCRARTTGIREVTVDIDQWVFTIIDVGGQRSERRKWVHCFEDVTAVIFVAALNEYDMVLYEASDVNRMEEALSLFDEVVNNDFFASSSVILFLNKVDLFEAKLAVEPLSKHFDAYDGDDLQSAVAFVKDLFLAQCNDSAKQVYVHETTATDTSNVSFVFESVRHMIVTNLLRHHGF